LSCAVFAGSLTKRVLSFAARFEEFADTLNFNVLGNLVPLAFASVVLWHYDPLLVAGLAGLIAVTGVSLVPLIRRRQLLVDEREEVSAHVSGRVADSIANMENDPRVRRRGPGSRRAPLARRRPEAQVGALVGPGTSSSFSRLGYRSAVTRPDLLALFGSRSGAGCRWQRMTTATLIKIKAPPPRVKAVSDSPRRAHPMAAATIGLT
jgi:hypothetical protein